MAKYNTIYISNILETFYKSYKSLSQKESKYRILYDKVEEARAFLYGKDNKVILTTTPINKNYKNQMCKLMSWNNVLTLNFSSNDSLCESIIQNKKLNQQLIKIIRKNPKIKIIPYRATEEFYELISYFEKKGLNFTTPETVNIKDKFIVTYAGSKRGFRHIGEKSILKSLELDISIPQGYIVGNCDEAIEAAWWFQQQQRSFVVKYNNGTQGTGIIFNHSYKLPTNKEKFINYFRKSFTDKIWKEPIIIVEELIKSDQSKFGGSPSVEFLIDEKGKVNPIYGCEQIFKPDKKTFSGVYIHPELMNHRHIKTAFRAGVVFGKELFDLGYKGYFDLDLVISPKNKLYAIESNLRRTGGTHAHEIALSLLGKNYWEHFHLICEDIFLPNNKNLIFEEYSTILKKLNYNPKTKTGFLFANPEMLKVGILHSLLIAKSKKEIIKLRSLIHQKISNL